MHITFICNEYPPRPQGGIGTFVYHMARQLHSRGHNITVAGLSDRDSERDDDGIRVVERASSLGRHYIDDRRRFGRWLAGDVIANHTDIVEVPEFDGMLPFKWNACPVAVRLHMSAAALALLRRRPTQPVAYWCERRTLAMHRSWIAVSRFVLEHTVRLFRLRPCESRVIYSFAPPVAAPDPSLVETLMNRFGPFVLYVGKLSENKGALDLARAARSFLREHPALTLVYVGRDTVHRGVPMSERIRNTVGLDLANRVHLAGERPHTEVAAWMKAARVYVSPSHLESFGMTVVEAASAGTPVIVSRRTAGPELITHRINGLLFEPKDPGQLSEAVREVICQPDFATLLADRARQILQERFSAPQCVEQTLAFYEHVRRSPGPLPVFASPPDAPSACA